MNCESRQFERLKSDAPEVSPKLARVAQLDDAILYEDEAILVLNKPSGTAVHGGSGLSFGVIEGLRALRPEARVSGVSASIRS